MKLIRRFFLRLKAERLRAQIDAIRSDLNGSVSIQADQEQGLIGLKIEYWETIQKLNALNMVGGRNAAVQ